ncbi:MarR family transcriptional regulator [Streptomyces misionensis]|uniref:MarR family transcriptional regulator n=1 Tax=Streptomyces misionensis TaxID=67331 RepID=A0A5C6J651_9ACTN|nr:MarR family transcriptional regulator [Streptomyces misionensis]TWV35917.1 MarR family transcriptional regulator [Streptomyces misionensis]
MHVPSGGVGAPLDDPGQGGPLPDGGPLGGPDDDSASSAERRIQSVAQGMLRDLARLTQALFRAGEYGLTRTEASLLAALETTPRRVTELAARTGMVQPRVTVLLQKLEDQGLVERRRCTTDRRAVETSLTPAGRRLLEQARQRMAAALLEALHSPTVEECERTVRAARQAVATLAEAMEPEAT